VLAGQTAGALLILMFVADFPLDPRRHWQRVGVRVVGSWTAASAVLVLALAISKLRM
jgi:hypothetical protein